MAGSVFVLCVTWVVLLLLQDRVPRRFASCANCAVRGPEGRLHGTAAALVHADAQA
jgi:hypothetical protein